MNFESFTEIIIIKTKEDDGESDLGAQVQPK